jgi:hypothetical protein
MSGLGLTQNERIFSAAFISSSNMTTELVKNLLIRDTHIITPDPAPPQAIEHYESLMTSEVGDLTTQNQSILSLARHLRARATLLAGAGLRNKARTLSLTLPQAHSWLLAVHYKPILQLSSNEFHQAARYRLGVSDHNHQGNLRCRQCDKVQNPRDQGLLYGDHSTQCQEEGSIRGRHNRLKNIRYHTLKAAGYSPQMETAHSYQTASSVLAMSTYLLVKTAWQFHMTSPWSRLLWNIPYLRPRKFVGYATETTERRKAVHYANNCAG